MSALAALDFTLSALIQSLGISLHETIFLPHLLMTFFAICDMKTSGL